MYRNLILGRLALNHPILLVNRLRKNVFFSDIYGDCHKLKIMGFDPPELDMLSV